MAGLDDDNPWGASPRRSKAQHEIGQPVESLSIDELAERIALLQVEIQRLEQARSAKHATKLAAGGFFRA